MKKLNRKTKTARLLNQNSKKMKTEKFKIGDEVYYSGFKEIYIIAASHNNKPYSKETEELLEKWDYLITQKDKVGLIPVKEILLREINKK